MINIRKSDERGESRLDWLESLHTFSFADYFDPRFMQFGSLRVINEDTVAPGYGFGTHSHRDMEIITYVIAGELEHKDSMGTGSIIKPGEIQRMSAGSGVKHSEINHSTSDLLQLLQIWIIPQEKNLPPSYEQKTIIKKPNQFILIGAHEGSEHVITIHQDVNLFAAYLHNGTPRHYQFEKGRRGWVQLVRGKIDINGHVLYAGDGAAIQEESEIIISCAQSAELLLFDLG